VGGGEVGEELELGAAKRRTVKGGRPTFVLNEIGSVARAERKKKGVDVGRIRVEAREEGERGPYVAVGSVGRPAAALFCEQGRVAGRGRRGAGAADRRQRGPGVSGGVQERVRENGAAQ
jgi:hypothetical protein